MWPFKKSGATPVTGEDRRQRARLARKLKRDARWYWRTIPESLAQVGIDHLLRRDLAPSMPEAVITGKRRRQKIRILEVRSNEDLHYLRVDLDPRHWPYGNTALDLGREEVLKHISITCGRDVDFYMSPEAGAWFKVAAEGVIADIPTLFLVKDALANLPDPNKYPYRIPIGLTKGRKIVYKNFAEFPHLLVAGSTGAGKSNFVNALLCTLLLNNHPDRLQFLMVDLKGGMELTDYAHLPHLWRPIVSKPSEIVEALTAFQHEMERRQELFRGRARSLETWNNRHPDPADKLPRIVLVIDELAQLLLDPDRKLRRVAEDLLGKTLSICRATGGNAIVSTQSPRSDVVTGYLKTNLSARLAFATASPEESRTIIGNGAAHGLAVAGRAVFRYKISQYELQTPMITDNQIKRFVKQASGVERTGQLTKGQRYNVTVEDVARFALAEREGSLARGAIIDNFSDQAPELFVRGLIARIKEAGGLTLDGQHYVTTERLLAGHYVATLEPAKVAGNGQQSDSFDNFELTPLSAEES